MSEDMAGLRALSEAATPGPWVVEGDSYGGDIYGPSRVRDYVAVDNVGIMPCVRHRPDADLIVAAVNHVRAALSSPETTPAGVLAVDVERLRRQNHEHAERRDREMAELRRQVDRYQNAYRRAKELVRGSPVDWSKDPKSQEPNGWWEYTSQNNRDVLMAVVLSTPAGVLPPITPIPDLEHMRSAMDVFTSEERADLIDQLERLARERRAGEFEAGKLRLP